MVFSGRETMVLYIYLGLASVAQMSTTFVLSLFRELECEPARILGGIESFVSVPRWQHKREGNI